MKRSFFALLRQDIHFELRHGIYTVYGVVCGMYLLLLLSLPQSLRVVITPLLIFTDPAVLGFFFMGGMILLERKQDVLSSLFVTPVSPAQYVLSKALSFSLLSLAAAFLIALPFFVFNFQLLPFILGVFFTSVLVGLISIPFAVNAESLNEYFLSSGLFMVIFMPPLIEYFLQSGSTLFLLFPTQASILLIRGAFSGISPATQLAAAAYLLLWIAAAWILAHRSVHRYIHRLRRVLL
ncbi:MAG: ABC transporter permease [Spirochaetia bacterium]